MSHLDVVQCAQNIHELNSDLTAPFASYDLSSVRPAERCCSCSMWSSGGLVKIGSSSLVEKTDVDLTCYVSIQKSHFYTEIRVSE